MEKLEPPKISVIIPTWNGEKILEKVVSSCLNQTLQPFEILVCDDGSTDNSKEIIKQINNPIVIWVEGVHSGTPAIPRNRGVELSKGDWIAFCDNDDEWLPTKLDKQINTVLKLNCKAICTNAIRKVNGIEIDEKMINYKKEKISFGDLLNGNNIVCSSSMVHKSILEKIGGFSKIIEHGSYADFICWLRVTTQTDFAFINESLVIYDDHPETSIRATETSAERIRNIAFKNIIDWSKQNKLPYFIYLTKKHIIKSEILSFIKKIIHA